MTGTVENGFTLHFHDIKVNNEIVTASEDGKMGFISADDIAEVIADALLVEKSYNTDFIIVGPELLSYDQVCFSFSFSFSFSSSMATGRRDI